jgi:hypothetical protein
VAAAHWSKPLPVLQFTKVDKVFTYDIVATRGFVDPVELGPWWIGHHGRPLELSHGPLQVPRDCTDSKGRWRGGWGCSLAVRFGGG